MYHYEKKGPKRGVALYSYSAEFGLTKTLEDCFEDLHDMGLMELKFLQIHILRTIRIRQMSGWKNGGVFVINMKSFR